jgi:hypothetical protein
MKKNIENDINFKDKSWLATTISSSSYFSGNDEG